MPIGVVAGAVAVGVMPWKLARSFVRSQSFPLITNHYRNGEQQVRALAVGNRKLWEIEVALTAANLTALRDFYVAHSGPLIPFLFYDVTETSPAFSYDATGIASTGRWTVRFDSPWEHALGVGQLRGAVGLRLIEVQ